MTVVHYEDRFIELYDAGLYEMARAWMNGPADWEYDGVI